MFSCSCSQSELELIRYLSLLVDDRHRILQLDIVKQTRQEDIGHSDQIVILLLGKERVGTFEVRPHRLETEEYGNA